MEVTAPPPTQILFGRLDVEILPSADDPFEVGILVFEIVVKEILFVAVFALGAWSNGRLRWWTDWHWRFVLTPVVVELPWFWCVGRALVAIPDLALVIGR